MINKPTNSVDPDLDNEDAPNSVVGKRLQELRLAHGMSQRKLAGLAGVTNGSISMIEQDRVSPSVASLKKVLAVFGLSLAEFFAVEFEPTAKVFYRADEMPQISSGLVTLKQIGRNMTKRKLQVLHESYEPNGDTGTAMLTHAGEEAGVIVKGEIEVTVGNQRKILYPGDSYYFSSRIPHRFRNPGTEICEIVSVCTPPTF